jgi:hypothetical protein
LATATAAGCGGSSPETSVPPAPGPDEACLVRAGDTTGASELVVALGSSADSVLLARQRTEPPIRLDCLGRPRPALASAWSRDSTGKTWTLTFADAGAVAASWRTRREAAEALRFAGVESVVPVDERRIVVTFRQVHDSVPPLFADVTLGLARDSTAGPALRALRVADARDALDGGADLVRSADPAVLDYAARRPGTVVTPLPWDRTYVLILPAMSPGLGPIPGPDMAAFRAALAGDAVRTEARAAVGPFWWRTAQCDRPPGSRAGPSTSSAVVYSRSDQVAGALAARLVAMADAPDLIARGVEPAQLAAALRAGTDRAYVVGIEHRALVPCREMAGWPPGADALALIDTRARLVARPGVPPLEIEFDGAFRPARTP